jgi:ABC-2 type transport system permease protein
VSKIWIVFKRELAAYFTSPIAYLVAFAVVLLCGLFFNSDLAARNTRATADGTVVLAAFAQLTLFFAPLLTMRLMAEENREGTIELLMTLPVNDSSIVIGKFLGAWAYYTVILALSFIYQVILVVTAAPDFGVVMSGYLGIWLFGGAALAVGILFSALTENQIVAAFLSLAAMLALWLSDSIGLLINNRAIASALRSFSFQTHYLYSFGVGLVRLDDIVFFMGVIALMLFATIRLVESRRWR